MLLTMTMTMTTIIVVVVVSVISHHPFIFSQASYFIVYNILTITITTATNLTLYNDLYNAIVMMSSRLE